VIDPVKTAGLSFLFFAMTVDVIGVVFQDLIKGIFYADFKQRVATTIGLLLTVARLVSYCLLVLMPYLDTYAWILIGNSLLGAVIWYVTLAKILDFRLALTRRILGIIKHTLADFGIWDHFNRTSIDTLLTVDVLILALLGYLQDIGNYAIALKFTSMLFLIPWQLTRGLQVYIANCANSIERFEAINTVIKTNAIISLLQLMVVLVGSDWMIHLLYGFSTGADVVRFTIVIAVGATIMNFGLPLCGLLSNSCSLRQVFLTVFLPALIIGISVYIAVTIFWGAMGTAYGNVIVYTIMLGTLILFAKRHCPFPLTLQLVTDREKEVIRGFVRG
jgi:O-antigen/teichoic acid export membrane protein